MTPNQDGADRAATRVGLTTLPIGLAAAAAPTTSSRLLRLGDHPHAIRAIGIADLALVPGLLAGRNRSLWMTARTTLNLIIAGYCLTLARKEDSSGAKIAAPAMVMAAVADSRTIVALRRSRSATNAPLR